MTDEWCTSPLFLEFRDIYAALRRGQPPQARVSHRFKEYIAWLKEQDLTAAEKFWRANLKGFSEPAPLVIDRLQTGTGKPQPEVSDAHAMLNREAALALRETARSRGLTPNTLIQAAFAVLLGRYANRRDVVFGITVSGRPAELPGIEETLGLFINTLPLRLQLKDNQRVCDWWGEIQAANAEMRQFEHTPLVQCQAWSEVPSGAELFQHLLVYENAPVDQSLITDRSILDMRFTGNRVHTNYPITATIVPGAEFSVRLTYQAERFEPSSIEKFLSHFLELLEAMIARPRALLGEFSLLTPPERRLILRDWNDTGRPYAPPADFVASFEAQAKRTPNACAARCGEEHLTYSGLNRRANCAAHGLIARGIGPESLVCVLDARGIDFLVMLLAVLKAGAVYVPLDPCHPRQRHLAIIKESGALLVLEGQASRQELASQLGGSIPVAALHEVEIAGAWENPAARAAPENLAYVIYTSGSTGTPKGAMVTRAGLFNNLMTKIPALGLGADDVIAQTASQAFDISVWQFLTPLLSGASTDILPDAVAQDPYALLGALREHSITIWESVPSMIGALLERAGEAPAALLLRWLLPTGEALSPDICREWFARFPAIPMLNAYGPAECADDAAYHRIDAAPSPETTVMPIGRPVANLRLYILDRWLEPVPIGVTGEIYVAGVGVGRGYINRPDLTASSFLPDPFGELGDRFYRTGDLARFCDDGTIEFLGRADDQVKIRGHRIEIGEIEAKLKCHPGLKDAAVKAWPDTKSGYRLVAYFVARGNEPISSEALSAFLRDWLPNYMVPASYIELAELPLNPNGKLNREALPEPETSNPGEEFQAPANPAEEIIAGVWAGLLSRGRIGRNDNFFALGGHSLLATQAIARINHMFHLGIPLRALFEAPTIASFAARIDAARCSRDEPALPPLIPAARKGALPLSHAQLRLWFMQQFRPNNTLYHFAVAVRITGPFDAAAFERSLNAMIERHEALRTIFKEEWGELRQEILPGLKVRLDIVETGVHANYGSGLIPAMRDSIAEPFDLADGPLLRANLYRPQPEQSSTQICAVLLCFHHIVFDGWSFGVFLKEFAALYEAYRNGDEPALPRLKVQYADYAVWQRSAAQSERLLRQRDYWTLQLKGAPPLLALPADRPGDTNAGDAAETHECGLTAFRQALDNFARQQAVTPFMTVLAAFAVLLRYLSGENDIVVGADVANRRHSDLEPLIGFFINLVALRIRIAGDPAFSQILAQVREITLSAYDHQEFPFEKLVEALRPERSKTHSAIFQVKLVFHNVPLSDLDLPGLRFETIPIEPRRTEHDLVLHVYEAGLGLRAVFEYRTALFEAATIARFAELFRLLLQRVLEEPGVSLSALLDFLTECDRAIRTAARSELRARELRNLQSTKRRRVMPGQAY
ncbi:MAG: amino acid adenylation domain-containing protein [Beijerinckiaceae bacterium]|nr:amino acid adenylation domain-containing protein [Beijerinckiaceae bacterium]